MIGEQEAQEIREARARINSLVRDWVIYTYMTLKESQSLFPCKSMICKYQAERETLQQEINQLIGGLND